jgi:hypothetical protein
VSPLYRFSLSNIFAFLVIVATVISLGGGLASESSLWAIWVASFLLFYWMSPFTGWRQIGRVTATIGSIWSISILWSYILCDKTDWTSALSFASRGLFVALAGIIFTLATACLVEGTRWTWHRWLRNGVRHRVYVVWVLLVSIGIAWGMRTITRVRYWEPTLVPRSSESLPWEFESLNRIKQRYDLRNADIVGCVDGRFIAARLLGQRKVVVVDAVTGESAANFAADQDEWFGSLAFRPDCTALAAIVYSMSSGPKLIQWDTTTWKSRDPVSIDRLIERAEPGDHVSFSLDHRFLLVVDFRNVSKEKSEVEISTIDLLKDHLTSNSFAAATIELKKLAAWKQDHLAPETIWWMASPNGKWIATSGEFSSDYCDYLFSREVNASRLQGRVIGFSSDGNHVVVDEMSERLVWKKKREAWESPPPFWDYLRFVRTSRVVIVDCRNLATVTQSRWFQGNLPRMNHYRSRLVSEIGPEAVLVWELPSLK